MIDQLSTAEHPTPVKGLGEMVPSEGLVRVNGLSISSLTLVALVGAILGAVGSFLPWVSADFLFMHKAVSGVEGGDGIISLVASIVAGTSALFMGRGRVAASVVVLVAGGITAAVAFYDIAHYYQLINDDSLGGSIAAGLTSLEAGIFITAAGGVVAALAGLIGTVQRS